MSNDQTNNNPTEESTEAVTEVTQSDEQPVLSAQERAMAALEAFDTSEEAGEPTTTEADQTAAATAATDEATDTEASTEAADQDGDSEVGDKTETPRIHEALAKISRAEAAARKRIQQEEQRIQRQQKELEPLAALKSRITDKKDNPIEVLQELGAAIGVDLSYEALTDAVLEGKLPEKSAKNAQQIPKEVQERIDRLERQAQLRAEAELDSQVAAYHKQVSDILTTKSEEYELILTEAQSHGIKPNDLVGQFVSEVYTTSQAEGDPKLLEPAEACEALESFLQSRLESYLKVNKAKKYIISPPADVDAAEPVNNLKQTPTTRQAPTRTLTNNLTGRAHPQERDDSVEARKRRAEAAVEKILSSQ